MLDPGGAGQHRAMKSRRLWNRKSMIVLRWVVPALVLVPALGHGASAGTDPAGPPAPLGWQRVADPGLALYRSLGAAPAAELRLYPPQVDTADLARWFLARLDQPVPGFGRVRFDPPRSYGGQVLTAAGRAGQGASSRVVMGIGCQSPGGVKRFAELVVPLDPSTVQAHAEAGARLVAAACSSAPQVAQAKPATPAAVAPGPAPAPAPARALQPGQIEGVLYAWDQIYTVTGLQMREWTYLLLKDGRVRKGLPRQPPDLFDVEADRQEEPGRWGRWRRSGGKVQVRFEAEFATPPGQLWRHPGKPGMRLQGRYRGSSSLSVGSVSTWAFWGLTLHGDGRFERWSMRGMGGTTGHGANATTTMAISDDKGSVGSVAGANFGGGSRSDSGVTDDDLEGTYQIDGWSLTLRYRSGATQRGFFYVDDDGDNVWFEGAELMRVRPDRGGGR